METTVDRRLWRVAGSLAIAHLVLMLAGFSLIRVAPLDAGRGTVSSDLVHWSLTKGYAGGYLSSLSFLLFLLAATLLARLVRGTSELAGWFSSTIAVAGSAYVAITLASGFADLGAALYDGHHGAPLTTVAALDHVHWFGVFAATELLGLFTLAVAGAVWVTGLLPRFVAYGGVVAGVACIAAVPGAGAGLVDDATLVWMLWFVALAVASLRGPRVVQRAAGVGTPVPA